MQINSNILMQINSKSYSEMTSADFIADVYLNDMSHLIGTYCLICLLQIIFMCNFSKININLT